MIHRNSPFAHVPGLRARCGVTVVVPAHNEAEHIARMLAALTAQCEIDGTPLAPDRFDVLVYANNCADATAEIVRAFAAEHPAYAIHVAEEWLPANVAHIGTARRTAMHAAAARFARAARDGVLAGTDADTIPAPTWLAWTLREMEHADVVLGRILVERADWDALPPHTQRMLRDEETYLYTIAQLESLIDPRRLGPWPRHWQRSGPSFAVRVSAYERVGGVPAVRVLEDIALYDALVAGGARIRHSLRVRVSTSARVASRASGGFGSRVAAWNEVGAAQAFLVEHPELTLRRLLGGGAMISAYEALEPVTAVEAIAILRQAIALGVMAERATRSSVASIAG